MRYSMLGRVFNGFVLTILIVNLVGTPTLANASPIYARQGFAEIAVEIPGTNTVPETVAGAAGENVAPVPALDETDDENAYEDIRADMIAIAERYLRVMWWPTIPNKMHTSDHHTPDTSFVVQPGIPANKTQFFSLCVNPYGCWEPGIWQEGVPYFWGGSHAIEDQPGLPELKLDHFNLLYNADEDSGGGKHRYFLDRVAHGAPAGGAVMTYENNVQVRMDNGAGVDCVGLINQVWRLGARHGISNVTDMSRPVKFDALRRGDVIMKSKNVINTDEEKLTDYPQYQSNHVILFDRWHVTDDPGGPPPMSNGPVAGTQFWAYESSFSAHKVTISRYELVSSVPEKDALFNNSQSKSDTDKVIIKRIEYCDPNPAGMDYDEYPPVNCQQDNSYTMDYAYPRSYFSPVSVIIVLDTYQLDWTDSAHNPDDIAVPRIKRAKEVIRLLRPGDKVGLVTYHGSGDEYAKVELALTTIRDEVHKAQILYEISDIPYSDQSTNPFIYLPLKKALEIFADDAATSGKTDPNRAVILLHQNNFSSDHVRAPVREFIEGNIKLFTSREPYYFNYDIDPYFNTREQLTAIAIKTGGAYLEHLGYFPQFLESVYGQRVFTPNLREIPLPDGAAMPKGTSSEQLVDIIESLGEFDSAMGHVTVALSGKDSPPYFELIQPDGTRILPSGVEILPDGTEIPPDASQTRPRITFVQDESYAAYTVRAPQPGGWSMLVRGNPGQEYAVAISVNDAMTLFAETDKKEYLPGEETRFTVSIEDDISGGGPDIPVDTIFVDLPEYVYDASVNITVEGPDGYEGPLSFDLLDDDQGAGVDGIYTASFGDTQLEGIYNFQLTIEGENNRANEYFKREKKLSIVVNTLPYVESIERVTASPTGYFEVEYDVTFSEGVANVDVDDFFVTSTGDISGAEVTLVEGEGKNYTVTVKTGNGNGTLRLDLINNGTILDRLAGSLESGDYTDGEVFEIYKDENSSVVTSIDDTDGGFCHSSCSLREAIRSAVPGDTITFHTELSGETINLASALTLTREVSINGTGLAELVTISGDSDGNETPDTLVFKVTSDAVVTLDGLAIKNGRQGISSDGQLTIINSIISDNEFDYNGGGISNSGMLTILDSILDNNGTIKQDYYGGGIYNFGALVISDTIFSNNFTIRGGGAIYNAGSLVVTNSTFSGNTAFSALPESEFGRGGAIYAYKEPIVVSNSTFFGNSAQDGGGIFTYRVTLALANSTFSDNAATKVDGVGGLYLMGSSTLDYSNNIIANSSGADCYLGDGTIGINSRNFVGDGTCNPDPTLTGELLLGPLADNGGPTQTMALGLGSLAIDAGDSAACPATDQRGVARPQGKGCDIGAYELAGSSPDAFGKVSPSDGATGQSSSLTLSWAPSSGADTYEYCLDTSNNATCDTWVSVGDETTAALSGLAVATTYHWQVRAVNADGTTEADGETWWSFTTSLSCPAGGIIHVDQNASGNNDGSSWDNAFVDLQTPLASLSEPCEIWVAAGTYIPHVSNRGVSFQLKNGVGIYGGFAGTETTIEQRDFETNLTILSGDLLGNDNENITRDEPTRAENSYHVLVASGTDDSAVLDGLTITGGNANEESYPGTCSGAGLYSDSGSPTLLNLIFSANSACDGGGVANYNGSNPTLENVSFNSNFADNGGGMANQSGSSPALKNVSFNSNSANHGGGMANYNGSSPTLENASFNSNTAGIGGGMANQSSTPTLENVSFNSNAAEHYGGGISNENNSSSVLINVTFSANSAVHDGGGMYNLGSSPTLNYVIFNGNTAGNAGGGMLINLASSPTLTDVVFEFNSASNFGGGTAIGTDSSPNLMNVTFHANSADYGGGMLNSQNSSPTLTNVTFSGNSAKEGGGMRNKSTSSPVLTNVTFSGNSAKKGGGMLNLDDSRPTLKNVIIANSMSGGDCVNEGSSALNTASGYNLIEDNVNNCGLILVSNNIIGQDPLLGKLQDNGGFTQTHALWLGSPAINAGTNTGCPATDQRGIARPQGARCDIGAYEYVRRIIFLKTGHIMIE